MPHRYVHLDLTERRKLAKWREAKFPMKEIALRLGRDRSTITCEIKRNWWCDAEVPQAYVALDPLSVIAQK